MSYYLYHHGILGQRWGKRNGPPYPLGASDHSASERNAGWRKSLDKGLEKSYNDNSKTDKEKRHLTDGQKRAIKIGATVAATALAAYGTYRLAKSGKLNEVADIGKNKVNGLLGKRVGDTEVGKVKVDEFLAGNADDVFRSTKPVSSNGFKKLAQGEKLVDVLKNTNPLKGTKAGENNCSACGIAAFLRRQGYDVTAKSTGGEMQNLGGVVEKCFKGAKVLDGSATKFGKSRNDAAEMLLKRYGQNAEGVVSVQWRGTSGGHIFNWRIKDGVVSFFDAQQGLSDDRLSMIDWNLIDPQGALQLARLDGLEVNLDAIKEFVQ